jgi:tetratricopeptide (TPR) repeat protein
MRISAIAIVVALFLWPAAVFGQSPELTDAFGSYEELYDQRRYHEALPFAEKALELGIREFGANHLHVGAFLNNLALVHAGLGHYADAELFHKRALTVNEHALGPGHLNIATSLDSLASLYQDQGRYAEAEPLYERALEIWEKALGPDHPDVALGLNNLAGLYDDQKCVSPLIRTKTSSRCQRQFEYGR